MNRFRLLLLDLSNSITTDELTNLKFACSEQIPAGRAEKIKHVHDFFSELERLNLLADNNREFLASLLLSIRRPDLRNKLLGIREAAHPAARPGHLQGPWSLDTTHVPEELITELVEDVSTDWKMVGRHLKLKEAVLRNIEDEKKRVVERAIEMFAVWQKRGTPTIQVLANAFEKAGRRDLAERVKDWAYTHARAPATEHGAPLPRPVQVGGHNFPTMQELDPTLHLQEKTTYHRPEEQGTNEPHQETTQPEQHAPVGRQPVQVDEEPDNEPEHDGPGTEVANKPHQDTLNQPKEASDGRQPVQIEPDNRPEPGTEVMNKPHQDTNPPKEHALDGRQPVQADEEPDSSGLAPIPAGAPVHVSELEVQLDSKGKYLNVTRYRTLKSLGSGSFGEVFCTKSKQSSECFAVKLINLGQNDRITQEKCLKVTDEIRRLSALDCQFLVKCLHTEEELNTLAIFSPYMAGGSIKDFVRQNSKIAEARVQKFTWQMLKGLEFLHSKEIIHKKLKGANVMLDESGNNVKLADYGIDDVMRDLCDSSGQHKTPLSTDFHWSSPELLQGQLENVTCKTDIWSLGCTVCEMLTGHPPLANKGLPPMTVMFKYCNNDVTLPSTCSSVAFGFFDKCFKNFTERSTATELLRDPFPCKTEEPIQN